MPRWQLWLTIAGWPAACRCWPRPAGFEIVRFDGHAYVQTVEPGYLLTLVDRGADALVNGGTIGRELAEALKAEARRRVETGGFDGSIVFASLIARKPS